MSQRYFLAVLAALLVPAMAAHSQQSPDSWTAVTSAIGRSGALQTDGVMKYGFPRGDLDVRIDGVRLRPSLALGSWVAFKRTGRDRAMVMGDLVLTESEVQPVIAALDQTGVRQSAVHNHLLGESPRIMYVHIAAEGDPVKIATAIHSALNLTKTPAAAPATPPAAAPFELDTALIHRTLGQAGKVNGGVYQVSVPRAERIRMDGETVPPSMGVATAINFQPTGGGRAAITGDFVMRGNEVSRIISILRANRIAITALHSHMIGENPRLYFMHFWANDDPGKLAAALRRALDQMK
jgi:hypothetical protein